MGKYLLFWVLSLTLLVACNSSQLLPHTPSVNSYPIEGSRTTPANYPAPSFTPSPPSSGYPITSVNPLGPTAEPLSPPFRLDAVESGNLAVTGQAPRGLALVIVDVTNGGTILGSGYSDESGSFTIELAEDPALGHTIGITVNLTPEQANTPGILERLDQVRGVGYRYVPNVVIVYDSYIMPNP